jgi:hypothetical protein
MALEKPAAKTRESGMMVCTGLQGVGKTYLNMHIIKDYVKDKFYNKVKGRKCLIMDTNGEYTKEQFERNDVENFEPRRIALKDIPAWSAANISECRRIDAKNVGIKEKKEILEYLLKVYRNGMLVIEDINTYILNMTHMEEIVGGLVNLRHRGVDILISYQSLRPVEPRIWQNARWVRMHYQADNVNDIKGKVTNITLFKIAQIIVNNRYLGAGDKRFYVYIHNFANKIEGKFTKQEFMDAARQYLNSNKKYIKEYKEMHNVSQEEAIEGQSIQYYNQYFGNGKK